MNICYCGTEAGYPHRTDCPYPLFHGDKAAEDKWYAARDAMFDARDKTPKPTRAQLFGVVYPFEDPHQL